MWSVVSPAVGIMLTGVDHTRVDAHQDGVRAGSTLEDERGRDPHDAQDWLVVFVPPSELSGVDPIRSVNGVDLSTFVDADNVTRVRGTRPVELLTSSTRTLGPTSGRQMTKRTVTR
jgi:hypothetical protein